MDPRVRCHGMEAKLTLQVNYGVSMNASDKWLSRYGFVENYTTEILHFGDVLQYDVYSQAWHGTWNPMSWNKS